MERVPDSSKSGTVLKKDWTQGDIVSNIVKISWPIFVLGGLWSVNVILEMIWLGKLGASAIAGVGIGSFVIAMVMAVKSGISNGEKAMVARNIGGGNDEAANHIAGQALIISAVYGLIAALIGILFTQKIFSLFNPGAEAAAEGAAYLNIVLAGWWTEAFWITCFSLMQSSGDTVTPMKIAIFIRIVNAVLAPFLILGWWIFPELGVRGAAITYITVTGLGMLLSFLVLFSGQTRLHLTLKDLRPDISVILRILKIGIPSAATGLGKSFGDLVMTWFMAPFGTVALAAHSLMSRIENFVNSPNMALGGGAGVLVGINLGAKQPKQASKSGWVATGLAAGIGVVFALIVLLMPERIITLFNSEPDLVRTGGIFLRIAAAGYLWMSVVFIMQNCIAGSGDTVPIMIISMASLWIVQLPLAFALSRYTSLGMYGVRWAIVIGFVVSAAVYLLYFQQGRWKHKNV